MASSLAAPPPDATARDGVLAEVPRENVPRSSTARGPDSRGARYPQSAGAWRGV